MLWPIDGCGSEGAPRGGAGLVEVADGGLAVDRSERQVEPSMRSGQGLRQTVACEEADVARLQRVSAQLATEQPAVEDDRVQRDACEAESEAVDESDDRDRFHLHASLLVHLLTAISDGE